MRTYPNMLCLKRRQNFSYCMYQDMVSNTLIDLDDPTPSHQVNASWALLDHDTNKTTHASPVLVPLVV